MQSSDYTLLNEICRAVGRGAVLLVRGVLTMCHSIAVQFKTDAFIAISAAEAAPFLVWAVGTVSDHVANFIAGNALGVVRAGVLVVRAVQRANVFVWAIRTVGMSVTPQLNRHYNAISILLLGHGIFNITSSGMQAPETHGNSVLAHVQPNSSENPSVQSLFPSHWTDSSMHSPE